MAAMEITPLLLDTVRSKISDLIEHYATIATANMSVRADFNGLMVRILQTDLQLVSSETDLAELWMAVRAGSNGFTFFTDASRICREYFGQDHEALSRYFGGLLAVHLPAVRDLNKTSIPQSDLERLTEHDEAVGILKYNPWIIPIYMIQTSPRFREMELEIHRVTSRGAAAETSE